MQAVTFNTNGKGYWSRTAKAVDIVDMRVAYINDEKDFGELRVYFAVDDFPSNCWDVNTEGLIYTDKQFKAELNAFLVAQGLCAVEYSEQGMQGDNYVSCDVEGDFLQLWDAKFNTVAA
jgi:hypothetical protein